MADEAFALSPISARATQPREEDYEAISDAFMETSRGRWFLGEYAKRNRNADTSMVLDAVARIEENLAAQRQLAPDDGLMEALAAIRSAVDEARVAAAAALDSVAPEKNLAPIRKGTRVIREISWRWREIGADSRICDLLDSQVGAIDASCEKISSTGSEAALSAAFDLIAQRIAAFDDSYTTYPRAANEAVPPPIPTPADEMPAAAMAEAAQTAAETAAEPTTDAADAQGTAQDAAEDTADDDAVLDMIAFEMALPDPTDIDDPPDIEADDIHVAQSPLARAEIVAPLPEPMVAPAPPIVEPSPELSTEPSPELSLGSTLIANGIVRRSTPAASDLLAPIRRMSQAERIAFFS